MTENLTSIKKMNGTKFIKGKKIPHGIGRIRNVIFYPDRMCVAGFLTHRIDFLLMFKRKRLFVPINGYYMYENLAFVSRKKGPSGKTPYKRPDIDPNICVEWLGLPVLAENGLEVGFVTDVTFVHFTGEVRSIETASGTVGKLVVGVRTIPLNLLKGYFPKGSTNLALPEYTSIPGMSKSGAIILVANEALYIDTDNDKATVSKAGQKVASMAQNAGVNTTAVAETAKSAAIVAGTVASAGAIAAGKHLEKTRGMFSAFKDEYDKARHDK